VDKPTYPNITTTSTGTTRSNTAMCYFSYENQSLFETSNENIYLRIVSLKLGLTGKLLEPDDIPSRKKHRLYYL
jgi:hypothetical protein